MFPTKFAIAIVVPGAGAPEIVAAALKYKVHIIDKEQYSAQKDYDVYLSAVRNIINDTAISLLFIFPQGYAHLVENTIELQSVFDRLKAAAN